MSMSRWWVLRLIWLVLGLLTGLIGFLPESAETLTGTITLLFILATLVLLGRWAVVIVSEKLKSALAKPDPNKTTLARHEFFPGAALELEASKVGAEQPPASHSKTELSRFKFAGFHFRTILDTEEEKLEPRKKALMWDSVLFAGGIIACALPVSLFN
jgi:hypothetical protein